MQRGGGGGGHARATAPKVAPRCPPASQPCSGAPPLPAEPAPLPHLSWIFAGRDPDQRAGWGGDCGRHHWLDPVRSGWGLVPGGVRWLHGLRWAHCARCCLAAPLPSSPLPAGPWMQAPAANVHPNRLVAPLAAGVLGQPLHWCPSPTPVPRLRPSPLPCTLLCLFLPSALYGCKSSSAAKRACIEGMQGMGRVQEGCWYRGAIRRPPAGCLAAWLAVCGCCFSLTPVPAGPPRR